MKNHVKQITKRYDNLVKDKENQIIKKLQKCKSKKVNILVYSLNFFS